MKALSKWTVALLLLALLPTAALAGDLPRGQPRWSLEAKGGVFAPALRDWSRFYGKRDMPSYAVSLAYKVLQQVELGAGWGLVRGKGQAFTPLRGLPAGSATYVLYPVNAFVLARGVVHEEQWLVPYAGGGFTRMGYRQSAEGGRTVRGSVDGYHIRGGLQFSLDHMDPGASRRMRLDYGVLNSYFFIEAEYTRAVLRSASIDLGGTAFLAGLLLEF